MKEIVLKLYEFDELPKDSQERIIERERWNIMDCCMEAYGDDYISTMKSFGDLTNTEAYGWEYGAKILIEKLNNVPVDSWEQYLVDLLKGKPRSKEPVYFMKYVKNIEAGRIVRNKRGEKAYLINSIHYSSTTSKHQYFVRSAIPTDSKIFSVGYNMSNTGNMAFVTSKLESIKDAIEKYKRVRTELPYRDVWGVFKNMMDYIEFFGMGTPQRLLKKSVNEWLHLLISMTWR